MANDLSAGLRAQVLLQKYGFHFTHSIGQNFILDDDRVDHIIDAAAVASGDNVLEIGPGAGIMTAHMLARGAHVLAIELDQTLEPVLSDMTAGYDTARIVYGDALKIDLDALIESTFGQAPFTVVANLPYYITTDIIERLLALKRLPTRAHLMTQREAAQRILSVPGEKTYCALAALVAYYARAEVALDVPRQWFTPSPHVDSCVLRLMPYRPEERPLHPKNEARFLQLVRAAFLMRRKTLVNNMTAAFALSKETAEQILDHAGIDRRVRGEALELSDLCRIADAL